jgi:hypothetical protein
VKELYGHIALIAIGAVIVIWFLMREAANQAAGNGAVISDPESSSPDLSIGLPASGSPSSAAAASSSYPNSAPIQLGSVTIGGSPSNLTYNTFEAGAFTSPNAPTVAGDTDAAGNGASCSCESDCQLPGKTVSKQIIPARVFAAASENLSTFQSKISPIAIGVPPDAYNL